MFDESQLSGVYGDDYSAYQNDTPPEVKPYKQGRILNNGRANTTLNVRWIAGLIIVAVIILLIYLSRHKIAAFFMGLFSRLTGYLIGFAILAAMIYLLIVVILGRNPRIGNLFRFLRRLFRH